VNCGKLGTFYRLTFYAIYKRLDVALICDRFDFEMFKILIFLDKIFYEKEMNSNDGF
jgi:hypothetical protein